MPIYEYRCDPCAQTFETLVRGPADVPHCPRCGGIDLAKQFSVPAAAQAGHGRESSLPVCNADSGPAACGPGQCRTGLCSFE
jgi:putative FmdB family regulatory protein